MNPYGNKHNKHLGKLINFSMLDMPLLSQVNWLFLLSVASYVCFWHQLTWVAQSVLHWTVAQVKRSLSSANWFSNVMLNGTRVCFIASSAVPLPFQNVPVQNRLFGIAATPHSTLHLVWSSAIHPPSVKSIWWMGVEKIEGQTYR